MIRCESCGDGLDWVGIAEYAVTAVGPVLTTLGGPCHLCAECHAELAPDHGLECVLTEEEVQAASEDEEDFDGEVVYPAEGDWVEGDWECTCARAWLEEEAAHYEDAERACERRQMGIES